MGKLQNKVLLKLGVIVVISAIACQAYQQQHSSDSDYSENVSQHPAAVHRHHKHHNQHRLNSVSLGHRNSSRYSIISGGSAAGNHYPQQPQQTHNYHHNSAAAGNTVGHHHQQQPQWYHSRTPRTRVNDNGAFRPGRPTGGSAQGQAGNTALGAVRPVKRMLKHNNHHNHHRNVTG